MSLHNVVRQSSNLYVVSLELLGKPHSVCHYSFSFFDAFTNEVDELDAVGLNRVEAPDLVPVLMTAGYDVVVLEDAF